MELLESLCISHVLSRLLLPKGTRASDTSHVKDSVLVIGTPRNPSSQLSLGKITPSRPAQAISFLPTHLAFSLPSVDLCNLPSSAWFGSGQTHLN